MVTVERLKIKNFKCFEDFEIEFNDNVNIIVGNNEEGKSTILEALHLALSGMLSGKTLFSEISESIFNKKISAEYIDNISKSTPKPLPTILIEVYLKGDDVAMFEGDNNTYRDGRCGIGYKICFNELYQDEYQALVQQGNIKTIPVEYYKIERYSFARAAITNKSIPIKSVIIDSSSNKYQNGSDIYISKIIKDNLDEKELTAISQSYRKLKENFGQDEVITNINSKISNNADISNKKVSICVDMSVKSSWESILMTYIDDVPFHQIGKGEQCIIKTNLALAHSKAQTSNLILIEEPENHLSHSNLNILLKKISAKCSDKQLIITTHSSFVANKLNLNNLILLSNKETLPFKDFSENDASYFQKLPGYDTLRVILSKSVILVEGPSDELIVQRAFLDKYNVLPIEYGIDVISVRGLSFKRFLEISKKIKKKIAVVTDNDGNYNKKISEKYKEYNFPWIKICASDNNNLKTLEPHFVNANKEKLSDLINVLDIKNKELTEESLLNYLENNKTEWALSVFNASMKFNYPDYINNAINWVMEDV